MKASNPTEIPTALTVRVAQPHEVVALDAQLADHHYLGAGRPVGDYLRQLVERDGVPVALLVWVRVVTRSRIVISGSAGAPGNASRA